jgi:hypothetical protein
MRPAAREYGCAVMTLAKKEIYTSVVSTTIFT